MTGLWPAGWFSARDECNPGRNPASPLILTAALPRALQAAADARRQPEAAHHAPAHLGLFRHLPCLQAAELSRDAKAIMAEIEAPFATMLPPVRREGLWVAPAQVPALDELREVLAMRWHGLLAPGDKAPPRLHISLTRATAPPEPLPSGPWRLPGLLLWQYGEACWTPLVALAFRG